MATTFVAARMRGSLRRLLLLTMLVPLGACASFQAHPEPVLNIAEVVNAANKEDIGTTLNNFYSLDPLRRDGLTQKGYRDKVIGTYMMAADVRYGEFRRRLSQESRGSSFLLDVGVLALSGGASLATEKTANALAAAASGLTGTRGALNRDVYFERTLPALIGAMDAARTEIRTTIMVKLRDSADLYTLPMALADVSRYEAAASLDSAIEAITADASDRADDAQAAYADEVLSYSGPPEAGVAEVRRRIRTRLLTASRADDVAGLKGLATSIGLTVAADATASSLRRQIEDKVASTDDLKGTQALATKMGVPIGEE